MHSTIQNFRGIYDLAAPISPILLLAGANGAGKTSACIAIAAAASGDLLPFDGLTKKTACLLVHDNQASASVVLETDGGTASVAWPAVERATQGRFPEASRVAVGLEDIARLNAKERAGRLIALIGASPTEEQFIEALKAEGVLDEKIAAAWKLVPKGWDSAHEAAKQDGARLKGMWERTAGGERYGSQKAATWRPTGWEMDLEGLTVPQLEQAVRDAEGALDKAKRKSGADAAALERMRAAIAELPALRDRQAEAQKALEGWQPKIARATKAFNELGAKPQIGAIPLSCPCCQAKVRLVGGALVEARDAEDGAVIAARIAAYEAAERALTDARGARDGALGALEQVRAKVAAAEDAERKLATAGDAEDLGTEGAEFLARNQLERAQRRVRLKEAVIDNAGTHQAILHQAKIVGALAEDGVRKTVLVDKLAEFNGRLVAISKKAEWAPVHIDADMGISYGGRPYSLCSAGEQFRARVTLQVAIAYSESAPLMVIDGADILDREGRNGLIGLVSYCEIPTVIGMTILRREEMPDLAAAGLGLSVWIENGSAAQVHQEAA